MTEPSSLSSPRFRLPISLRLTLWYGLSMLVLLVLFGGLLVTSLHWNHHILLHQRLFKAQSDLVQHVSIEEGKPVLRPGIAELGGVFKTEGALGIYARLLSPEGDIWDRSYNFRENDAFEPALPGQPEMVEMDRTWQGQPIRSLYAPIRAEDTVVGWMEVSAYSLSLEIHLISFPVGLAILVTVLLALGGGYVLARRALLPVTQLTEAANRITASELSIQLPVEKRWRDELTDLAETFNTMITRLGASFARERRFTADAAHELLNPLASVRNEAEVALRRPREPAAYQQTLSTILTDVERLGTMIEQLLELARIDADADIQRERLNMGALCQEATTRWQAAASDRQLDLTCRTAPTAFVRANVIHLEAVFDNLLENALKYTPAGGAVEVAVGGEGAFVSLVVTDSGIGFDPKAAERLFDRFHRAVTPDVHAQPGSGLGLAIVQAIVQAYGGSITASSEGLGCGSRFVVQIPRDRSEVVVGT